MAACVAPRFPAPSLTCAITALLISKPRLCDLHISGSKPRLSNHRISSLLCACVTHPAAASRTRLSCVRESGRVHVWGGLPSLCGT